MAKNPDVIIIGGGIVGASCALAIAKKNCSVVLLDAGITEGTATPAAAGMLGALAEAAPDDAVLALHVRARDIYCELVPELEEDTGIDIGWWTGGILHAGTTMQIMPASTEVEYSMLRSVRNAASGPGNMLLASGIDVGGGGKESLAVPNLHDVVVLDLLIRLARDHLKEIMRQ